MMSFNSAEHRQRIKEQSKAVADYMNTKLSPAAQAVLDASSKAYWDWGNMAPSASYTIAAAALRAAAEHCVPDDSEGHWVYIPNLLAIADELEAH